MTPPTSCTTSSSCSYNSPGMRRPSWQSILRLAGREWRRLAAIALSLFVLGGVGFAPLAPIGGTAHNELFEIPRGTWARRRAGEKIEILPQTIQLTLGLNDVLLL